MAERYNNFRLWLPVFAVVLATVEGKTKHWVGGDSDWADVTSWTGSSVAVNCDSQVAQHNRTIAT